MYQKPTQLGEQWPVANRNKGLKPVKDQFPAFLSVLVPISQSGSKPGVGT